MSGNSTSSEKVEIATGYMHSNYAKSLAEFGTPRELSCCGGWILQRQIPGFPYFDGMGCYPLFICRHWPGLHSDLENLRNELVTLSLVADPFGESNPAHLRTYFDVVIPFKEHYVTDLRQPVDTIVSKHHQRYAMKSLRSVSVERCLDPIQHLDEWTDLFATLAKRHTLKGIKAFSRAAFAKQLSIPGIVMFRAIHQGNTVGLDLWYVQGEVSYGHLAAFNPEGYRLRASYALKWSVIEYFANKVRWLDLGAGAGLNGNNADGLSLFKRGWSTGTRTAYFCGQIFDHERYSEIMQARAISTTDYFPGYRKGEFG